jgi:hypothetical protein
MPDIRLGSARVFVPVCKHPRDYQITTGPLGYEQVDEVTECPLTVKAPAEPGLCGSEPSDTGAGSTPAGAT